MAFASASLRNGTCGDLKVYAGTWTGQSGDAAGTVAVGGGTIYSATFQDQDTDGPTGSDFPVSVSTSGLISTISVYYHQEVVNGRFIIIYA